MKQIWVFDLDDTLYPEHQYVLSGFRAVDNWLVQRKGYFGFLPVAKRLFEDGIRGNIFDLTLNELGVFCEQKDILELVEVYRSHKPEIELYADAKWVLTALPQDQLGLITDGYLVAQRRKIEALSLYHFFHAIICSDEYGRENWKPSPLPYLRIMEYFDELQATYFYVGDNPQKDFIATKSLGWKSVMVKRDLGEYNQGAMLSEHKADYEVDDLYQISNLLS